MVDLRRHPDECEKNPGHLNFVPVDQFNVEHLPSGYQDNNIVDLVRAVSDLTVRVTVKCVSESRPETVPGTDKPYPFYRNRGRHMMRMGTGWVCEVRKYSSGEDSDSKTCDCKECHNSPTPKREFALITIVTATNVVFDQLEGTTTTCYLFFDRGGTPDVCSGVITLSGMSDVVSNIETDRSEMIHVTHDLDLIDRLNAMVTNCEHLLDLVKTNYCTPVSATEESPPQASSVPDITRAMTLIVSHPHGCSKQVSVGHCAETEMMEGGLTRYKYTTATCPGSAGALVCVLGSHMLTKLTFGHHHCGSCEENRELNFSGFGHEEQP